MVKSYHPVEKENKQTKGTNKTHNAPQTRPCWPQGHKIRAGEKVLVATPPDHLDQNAGFVRQKKNYKYHNSLPPLFPQLTTRPPNERVCNGCGDGGDGGDGGDSNSSGNWATHPVHLDQDAGLALSVAEGVVSQAGALPEQAALELAHLLLHLPVLHGVLVHHAQIVLLLQRVVVLWRGRRQGNIQHGLC